MLLAVPITLPYGPDAGDTLISLALNTINNIYVSGTLYGPEIQIDTESYSRFYVRSSASCVFITSCAHHIKSRVLHVESRVHHVMSCVHHVVSCVHLVVSHVLHVASKVHRVVSHVTFIA